MDEDMKTTLRNILGVVAGVLVGAVVIFAVQFAGHQIYPVAGSLDMNDKEAMAAFMASLPVGALLIVIAAYAAGSFVGGGLAALICRGARIRHALVVGVVLLLSGVMNLVAIPHPVWFSILTVLVFLPAAWLGGRMVARPGQSIDIS